MKISKKKLIEALFLFNRQKDNFGDSSQSSKSEFNPLKDALKMIV